MQATGLGVDCRPRAKQRACPGTQNLVQRRTLSLVRHFAQLGIPRLGRVEAGARAAINELARDGRRIVSHPVVFPGFDQFDLA
ncbi:hypothetical protein NBRC116599_35280 [Aquicoccus sp. SU-CL01552]